MTTEQKEYTIYVLKTGFFSGTLSATKMESVLNDYAKEGWRLARTIHERKRVLGIFSREAHFLIFER